MYSDYKPAIAAGFFALVLSSSIDAQNYIDVEAERLAAQRARSEQFEAPMGDAQREQTASAGVVSDGTTSDRAGTIQPGIRPYSGQTILAAGTVANPATTTSVANPDSVGDLVVMLQVLQEEVRRLNGLVEEQAQQLAILKEQSLERYIDLDRRLAGGVRESTPGDGVDSAGESIAETPNPADATMAQAEPGEKAAYQAAYERVKTRDFDQALDAFNQFLADYPLGRYAANAHYWLGELYLVVDPPEPELARQNFRLLLDQYPSNNKVPDTLYKLGRVHFIKGNRDRAKAYLDRVIAEYPEHPAAQYARDFLQQNF